jgi:DNA-binding transcriptional MerR regulator
VRKVRDDTEEPAGRGDGDRRLSRRTGVPVKALREYEDLGLIYTAGRSAGNYRLFSGEVLWCSRVTGTLRRQAHILATRDAAGLPAAAAPR